MTLNAGRVTYDDEAGKAAAVGDAVLTYEGAIIRAERIDYDAVTQIVTASPDSGGAVTLESMGRTLTGRSLEYGLITKEGVLDGVKSELDMGTGTLYISGDGMRVMPYELAVQRGLVSAARKDSPAYAGVAANVSMTTCALDHPHYHVVAKSMIFIPGKRVVAKKPRLYLGGKYIFTYPMDYIVRIDRRALQHQITPYFEDNEVKGTGIGVSGAFAWNTGSLSLGASVWSETGMDWMLEIDQSLGGAFSFEGGVRYVWNEAWNEKHYSPYAGFFYRSGGWEAALRFSWTEYIEIQKDASRRYRGRLARVPEFNVLSPWLKDPMLARSWFRFRTTVGGYEESTTDRSFDSVLRYGFGIRNYFEYPLGGAVTFFSNTTYDTWFYDQDGHGQEILNGFMGFRYNLGAVELASGYERRFAWGTSPMLWDLGSDRERFHQKVRFPLGKEFYLAVHGSYDFDVSEIDEVRYALQWITDCMKWELRYYDDRTSGDNSNIGISLSILAYPETPMSFGQEAYGDPFARPGVPK